MLKLTFRNGDTVDVVFNHESVLAVSNVEAGVERRGEWTDVARVEYVDGDPVPATDAAADTDNLEPKPEPKAKRKPKADK